LVQPPRCVKLCVRRADADSAASLLAQGVPEKFDVEGVEEYQQAPLPKVPVTRNLLQGLHKPVTTPVRFLAGICHILRVFGMQFLRLPVAGVQRETSGELVNVSILCAPDCDDDRDHFDLGDRSPPPRSHRLAALASQPTRETRSLSSDSITMSAAAKGWSSG